MNRDLKNHLQEKNLWFLAILFSIFFHFYFLFQNLHSSSVELSKNIVQENVLKIHLVDQKSVKKRQIVNTTHLKEEEKLKQKSYLGERDHSVSEETKAAIVASFKNGAKGNSSENILSKKESLSLKKLAFKAPSLEEIEKISLESIRKIKGTKDGLKSETGLAQSSDFLEEIPLGNVTKLNTQKFKYFGFYQRIREQLEQHWGKSLRAKVRGLLRKGRRPASGAKHLTSLHVTLNEKGKIIRVALKDSSGISEFDHAAVEAFNKAGPFPNPPRGMIQNGLVVVEWGFVVEV